MLRALTTLLALACLALAACGGGADPDPSASSAETAAGPTAADALGTRSAESAAGAGERGAERSVEGERAGPEPGSEDGQGPDRAGSDAAGRLARTERAVAQTVREYVAALDRRAGADVCALLADEPGLEGVRLPRSRGDCSASLSASIGYRDPRGLPVWESAEVASVSVEVEGDSARAVATVVTEFADRDEPSIEDDVVYLVRRGGGWLVAKPSSTLLRAVGIADVPPSVLTPP